MGDYGVLRRMAVGGMAEIFLARKAGAANVDRLVVLKRILPQFAHNEDFVQMFLNEARIASTLHHPNIVQVHSIGEERGQYFFAMEYLHGEDLARILARAEQAGYALQLDSVLSIMIRVCAGLHYAHERTANGKPLGIVHRDVSPHNVFVTYDGGVKLLDFGIAKATTSIGKTKSGALKGKVEYMSPEQAFSQPVDRRSDVFCIGILLWELTTGRRLYRRRSDLESLKALTEEDAPAPSTVVSSYPAELERIVLKCLRRKPEERWETCEELQAALDTFGKTQSFTVSPLTAAKLMHVLFSAEIAAFQHAVKGGGSLTDHIIARIERIAERAAADSWDADVANVIVNLGPNDDPALERKFSESGAILVEADEPEPKQRGLPQGMKLAPLPGAAPLDKIVEPPTGPMTLASLVLPVAPAPIPMPVLVQGEPTEIMAVPPVHEPDPLPGVPPAPEVAKTAAGSISTPSTTSRTEVSVTFDAIPKGLPEEPNTEALTTPHPGRVKPILGTAILARDTSPPEPEPLPPPAPPPRRFATFGLIAFVAAGLGAFVAVQLMKRGGEERPPAPAVAAQPEPTVAAPPTTPTPAPPVAEPTAPPTPAPAPTPPETVAAAEPAAESPADKKKKDEPKAEAKSEPKADKADKADKAKARAKRAKKNDSKKKRPSTKDLDSLPI